MATPDDKRRNSPADRFRDIMSADKQPQEMAPAQRYPKDASSTSWNLPKPGIRSEALPPPSGPSIIRPTVTATVVRNNRFLPAFWTVASIISLLFNVVLLILVVGMLRMVGSLDAASLGSGVLGGLYTNFERMDQAHIRTEIPVQAVIPINLTVPVQTTTGITLAKAATISGAHVKISTQLFNVDAPAVVTLPAGTPLDVTMSMDLPVQAQLPLNLTVPVDIPVSSTDLHPAITGLQNTVKPLYCIVNPSAKSLTGDPVCK
jgi:hypothetical protein